MTEDSSGEKISPKEEAELNKDLRGDWKETTRRLAADDCRRAEVKEAVDIQAVKMKRAFSEEKKAIFMLLVEWLYLNDGVHDTPGEWRNLFIVKLRELLF